MEFGKLLTGCMFLVVGGINAVRPDIFIRYQRWVSKNVYGAEYKPSKKTFNVQKILGVVFVIIGLSVLVF